MSPPSTEPSRQVIPAQLAFLAIYNPALGTSDDNIEDQIVYYSSPTSTTQNQVGRSLKDLSQDEALRQQKNEQLRQIGLAQGMVEFGRSFSDGMAVDTVDTERSRIVLHELEAGWWILASINLTVLSGGVDRKSSRPTGSDQPNIMEYSSREVKPAILLIGDLLRAHSTFLLHHASSLSELFVQKSRSKFIGLIGRYWNKFILTWNVLMHGNPANNLYGGIKIAACGELGVGVGEEDRGSGEREVLEGFVGHIEGLVDVVVSKFGDITDQTDAGNSSPSKNSSALKPSEPWLGSGKEPGSEDGAIFLGTGALSRKSLRNVTHWVEDLYRWGPYAYGVIDDPALTRRTRRSKNKRKINADPPNVEGNMHYICTRESRISEQFEGIKSLVPNLNDVPDKLEKKLRNGTPPLNQETYSHTSSDGESSLGNKFVSYLKLGYGKHWSLGESSSKNDTESKLCKNKSLAQTAPIPNGTDLSLALTSTHWTPDHMSHLRDKCVGYFLIGLMGDIEDLPELDCEPGKPGTDATLSSDKENSRLLIRTLTIELEREEDTGAEAHTITGLGQVAREQDSKYTGSEDTVTVNPFFENQDRNKAKNLRVVVYVNKPFVFVFLFKLGTDALERFSLYRSLHQQIRPLLKPLLTSTTFRVSMPDGTITDPSTAPVYDLVWDPELLTINSNIPNIPEPFTASFQPSLHLPWTRIEALNAHMQIINTYVAGSSDQSEIERTSKTNRGWWVVRTRIPESVHSQSQNSILSGQIDTPSLITKEGVESPQSSRIQTKSQGTRNILGESFNEHDLLPKAKEIFLLRRGSDYGASKPAGRFLSGSSITGSEASWKSEPDKVAQGIGIDTRRYIEALLSFNR